MLMQKQVILTLLILQLLLFPQAGWSQGIVSGAGAYATAGGLGAGLAASNGHGTGYCSALMRPWFWHSKRLTVQTQAIQQYMKLGCKFETR